LSSQTVAGRLESSSRWAIRNLADALTAVQRVWQGVLAQGIKALVVGIFRAAAAPFRVIVQRISALVGADSACLTLTCGRVEELVHTFTSCLTERSRLGSIDSACALAGINVVKGPVDSIILAAWV
jgi:hypothetical protein